MTRFIVMFCFQVRKAVSYDYGKGIPELFCLVALLLSIVFTLSLMLSFSKPLLFVFFCHRFFKI